MKWAMPVVLVLFSIVAVGGLAMIGTVNVTALIIGLSAPAVFGLYAVLPIIEEWREKRSMR